jgi:hypothetical protein
VRARWTKVAVLKSAFLMPAATASLPESEYSTTSTLPTGDAEIAQVFAAGVDDLVRGLAGRGAGHVRSTSARGLKAAATCAAA